MQRENERSCYKKSLSSPKVWRPAGFGDLQRTRRFVMKQQTTCVEDSRLRPSGMTGLFYHGNNAFTLIELLVVVLIIGILAAVAVPQYQRVVKKSRATEALLMLQKIYQTQQVYEIANGRRTTDLEELDIEIPQGFYRFNCNSCDGACCYAIPKDGSTPFFEGDPAGTLYCRGTEQECKTVFNVSSAGEDYWVIKL